MPDPTAIERTTLETIIKACQLALGGVMHTPEPTLKAVYDLGFRDGRGTVDIAEAAPAAIASGTSKNSLVARIRDHVVGQGDCACFACSEMLREAVTALEARDAC